MPEEKTTVPAAPEEQEPKTEPSEEPQDKEPEDQKSPYEEELKRIEAEKLELQKKHDAEVADLEDKRRKQMEIKDRALEKAKKDSEPFKADMKREMRDELIRELDAREVRSLMKQTVTDPTARKVIMHYYDTLPDSLRSGDPQEDLNTAIALANRKRMPELLSQQSADNEAERRSISSMGGGGNLPGRSGFERQPSATARTASRLASAFAGGDKDVSKKLNERINKRK